MAANASALNKLIYHGSGGGARPVFPLTNKREFTGIISIIHASINDCIQNLKNEYDRLKPDRESLLRPLEETKLPKQMHNSNVLENSTLTLKEAEHTLLEQKNVRTVSVHKLFEAQNLARIIAYDIVPI